MELYLNILMTFMRPCLISIHSVTWVLNLWRNLLLDVIQLPVMVTTYAFPFSHFVSVGEYMYGFVNFFQWSIISLHGHGLMCIQCNLFFKRLPHLFICPSWYGNNDLPFLSSGSRSCKTSSSERTLCARQSWECFQIGRTSWMQGHCW